jgi:hypothetical protein
VEEIESNKRLMAIQELRRDNRVLIAGKVEVYVGVVRAGQVRFGAASRLIIENRRPFAEKQVDECKSGGET